MGFFSLGSLGLWPKKLAGCPGAPGGPVPKQPPASWAPGFKPLLLLGLLGLLASNYPLLLVLLEFPIVHTLIRRGRKDDAELVENTGRIVVPILFLSFNI